MVKEGACGGSECGRDVLASLVVCNSGFLHGRARETDEVLALLG
jgi:hypothetical protein